MTQSNYDKELRIGLVLYGGVSLAIYIYGVVYEFLRLVRGESAYAELTKTARIKPVIDVISGSSAGGINGLFLAKALTTGGSLNPLKELWIQDGDLEELINADSKKPISLLNSVYYEGLLREALKQVKPDPTATTSKRGIDLLDLFITATNLDGIVTEYGEPFCRNPIQTKNYSTVFHFKARPGHYDLSNLLQQDTQKILPEDTSVLLKDLMDILRQEREALNDLGVEDNAISTETGRDKNYYLARVAAATSSFPVAFAPVHLTEEDVQAMKNLFGSSIFKSDTLLPNVRQEQINQTVVYGDGGMVNNKPFSHTVRTIFHRQADLPVDRKLFFIEPDPTTFNESNRLANRRNIDGIDSLLKFFEATFYQSISADLEALVERNQRIQNVQKILTDFEATLAAYLTQVQEMKKDDQNWETDRSLYEKEPVYRTYRQIKITALHNELEERLFDKADINRLISEMEQIAPEAMANKSSAEREVYAQDLLKVAFEQIIAETYHSLVTNEDVGQFLRRFDYPFRNRRLRYFIGKLNDWLAEIDLLPELENHFDEVKSLRERLGVLKGKIYTFIEFYEHGSWLIWDQAPSITKMEDVSKTFDYVSWRYDKLMDDAYKKLAFEMIGDDLAAVIKGIEALRPQPPYTDSSYYEVREKTAYLENMLNTCSTEDMTTCMERVFNTYEFLDMYLYPATLLANVGEADPIEVIRVSPKDATRYKKALEDKLAGEKLMHFSAFLKRSWRENDLLWGRLDAAEIIVRTILPNEAKANKILDTLAPTIIEEELNSIRARRETELSQAVFTDTQQQQIKEILNEQISLKGINEVENYLQQYYAIGTEGFENVAQGYLLRTLAKSLRTVSRMFEQRSDDLQKQSGAKGPLNKPIQYLSALLNLPYIFLVTLGGSEETQRQRLINYSLTFAVVLIILQLVGAVDMRGWLLLGIVTFIFLYLRPQRLIGVILLIITLVTLLIAFGAICITIRYPWLISYGGC